MGGAGPTCCTWANTCGVGEVFRLLPCTAFVSALLLSGGTNNYAVVDRPHRDEKTYEGQFPDLGKIGFP